MQPKIQRNFFFKAVVLTLQKKASPPPSFLHVSHPPLSRFFHLAAQPMSHPQMRRSHRSLPPTAPDYTEDSKYVDADRALLAIGQGGIHDPRHAHVHSEDREAAVEDGSSSSSQSMSEGDDENRDHLRSARRRDPIVKSDEWLAAERLVAVSLGVAYPAGLGKLVKGLSYVSHALSMGMGVADQARVAFRRLMWNTPVTDLDRDACITYATALSRTITVDRVELCAIFAPLEKFTGGRLVKAKQHIVALFAIALMAQMVDALLHHRAHGTQQEQDFQRVLAAAGLDPHTVAVLVPQSCTETAQDCAERAGRDLATALNRLAPADRIAAMFQNLASFEHIALQHPLPKDGRRGWCRALFDQTRPRNVHETAAAQGAAIVSVTLLVRDAYTQYVDASARRNDLAPLIDAALPDGYGVSEALYQPRLSLANLEGGPLVATHRAHAQVLAPTDTTVVQALRDLLLPDPGRRSCLSRFLDALACEAPERFVRTPDGARGGLLGLPVPSDADGTSPPCAYVAVRYGGRMLKLGRKSIRCRSFAPELRGARCSFGTSWLELDADMQLEELRTLLVPPFAPLLGHVEIFVALTEPPPCGTPDDPGEGPLSLPSVRSSLRARAATAARNCAREEFLDRHHPGQPWRTLSKRKRKQMEEALDAADAAARASVAVRIEYPEPPLALTAQVLERADITRNAMTAFERVVRAELGGADAREAADRFATHARPTADA